MPNPLVVLVQAGHERPFEPGIRGSGAPGEVDLNIAIRNALVARLQTDARFRAVPAPGDLPDGMRVDAALFLHCDGVENPAARGFSFGYPTSPSAHKSLAERIATEFLAIAGHPSRREDNGTADAARYYGYHHIQARAMCLVEHGFVTNPSEHQWLKDHVQALAEAEYRGICAHFELLPGTTPVPSADFVTTANSLNLRKGPSTSAPILASLDRGTQVRRLRVPEGAWVLVEVPMSGFIGWVSGSFLVPAGAGPIGTDTLMIGGPRATAAQIAKFIVARRPANANGYSDDDVRNIVDYYFRAATDSQIDPLVACAQMALETGFVTSPRSSRPECNPAGIGVEQSGQPGVVFRSWRVAVPAHVGRLLAYALPAAAGTSEQQRIVQAALVHRELPDHFRGAAPRLGGLTGKWAADPLYADKIARLAEGMRVTPLDTVGATSPDPEHPMMDTRQEPVERDAAGRH